MSERPAVLGVLPDGYGELFDRVVAHLEPDERVRAMWLHGSLGRGDADVASDLDIDVAVADDAFDEFAAAWPDWLAQITPTVSATPVPGLVGSFFALTPTCERLDILTERVSALPASSLTRRVVVFDKDGLTSNLPAPQDRPPNLDLVRFLLAEPIRQAAGWATVVVRKDWLMGVVAVQQIHMMLYQLFVEANMPAPTSGAKQWSSKLTAQQRAVLELLPVPQPEAASVEACRQAALQTFFLEAPRVADQLGVEWPAALADAVVAYLEREGLGVTQAATGPNGS